MQKQRKFNPKKRPHKENGKAKGKPNGKVKAKPKGKACWEAVKISGPVIADEGADLGGFIGLEVMENYNGNFVRKEKVAKDSDSDFVDKGKKSNRKRAKDSDDDNDSEMEVVTKKKKQKKQKLTTAPVVPVRESNEEDSGSDDQPKKKTSKAKLVQSAEELKPEREQKPRKTPEQKLVKLESSKPNPGFSMLLKQPQQQQKLPKKNSAVKKDIKNDAQKPYSSVDYMSWIELGVSEPIVRALAEKGFKVPTEIQSKSLPVAIFGRRDLLGAAETGSGKTLAFGIPMLEGIMKLKQQNEPIAEPGSSDHELTPEPEECEMPDGVERVFAEEGNKMRKSYTNKPLYGLILTPTRELAVQINDHLKAVAKYTDINIATVFGGLAAVKQERILRKCPEIVIATPGRLWDLIKGGNHHLSKMVQIRFLVIDETDRMLEKGHFDELKQLLELLNTNEDAKKLRRNYIFSATLTMDHELPEHLMRRYPAEKLSKHIHSSFKAIV